MFLPYSCHSDLLGLASLGEDDVEWVSFALHQVGRALRPSVALAVHPSPVRCRGSAGGGEGQVF